MVFNSHQFNMDRLKMQNLLRYLCEQTHETVNLVDDLSFLKNKHKFINQILTNYNMIEI